MRYLSLQEVLELHDRMIQAMGGLSGANPKQIALLDSALTQIQNDDYYPSFIDKLTHLMFACVKFHPFARMQQTHRTLYSKAFIKLNRPDSLPADFYQRLEDVIVSVASDEISKDELAQILSAMLKGN
ncbi:Fic family protein [Campylobacter vulpis]|uniref:Fic family protein n=1 Tax=Campylobacter vulpis TaxID=1655500 RepID=UPI001BCD2F4F|nr:Fic family protein [Campylobacter vulpis]MBS4235411.1 type II toxin-antitoxin system death-on-curing family toxin [Campylobacter vulpis]MBS4269281.1 type II toxin-antitoxin system death-on-curing family toxin [Campylobacter vulpis]